MRVLVCGGLDYTDRAGLYAELDRLHAEYAFGMVIVGGVSRVDTLAVEWARVRGIATQVFTTEWRGNAPPHGGPASQCAHTGRMSTGSRRCFSRWSQDGKHGEASEGGGCLGSDG
jgi:YspA, cpYpsA-related SLOG family